MNCTNEARHQKPAHFVYISGYTFHGSVPFLYMMCYHHKLWLVQASILKSWSIWYLLNTPSMSLALLYVKCRHTFYISPSLVLCLYCMQFYVKCRCIARMYLAYTCILFKFFSCSTCMNELRVLDTCSCSCLFFCFFVTSTAMNIIDPTLCMMYSVLFLTELSVLY